MLGQRAQVVRALAQRGQGDVHGPHPVQQVLAEFAPPGHDRKVAVGGRHQPEIALHFLPAAHGAEAPFLQHAQKGFLQGGGQFAYLVQKQRAARRLADQPFGVAVGPGEGPAHVAEEHAFGQVFGQGGAVHHHEGMARTVAVFVDGPRGQFLAGARFAGDQHRHVASRGLGHQVQALHEGGAAAHDARRIERASLRGGPGQLFVAEFQRPQDGQADGAYRRAFGDVVPCAVAHGHLGRLLGVGAGDDDHLRPGRRGHEAGQRLQPVAVGHHHVQQHHVAEARVGMGQPVGQRGGPQGYVAHVLGEIGQGFRHQRIVVDDEDFRHPLVFTPFQTINASVGIIPRP